MTDINKTEKSLVVLVFLVLISILLVFIIDYFDVELNDSISILEQNKELSKVEAVEIAKELGCTRIVDLGDVYVPCSSVEEYDYVLKIYNLKEKIEAEQRENFIFNLLIYTILFVVISLIGFVMLLRF